MAYLLTMLFSQKSKYDQEIPQSQTADKPMASPVLLLEYQELWPCPNGWLICEAIYLKVSLPIISRRNQQLWPCQN